MARDLLVIGATKRRRTCGSVPLRLSDRAIYNGSAGAEIQELFAHRTGLSESLIVFWDGSIRAADTVHTIKRVRLESVLARP